jgi:hypothetical protein
MDPAPTKLIGCSTCAVTVKGDGSVVHEPSCVTQEHARFKGALHKIAHVLKEIGITAAEVGVETAAGGLGAFGEDQ